MLKILLVEDNFMIADAAEALLTRAGYAVCGIARTTKAAATLAEAHKPDLFVIDLQLAEGRGGTDLPPRLGDRASCGILFATGSTGSAMLTEADGHACLAKPYGGADLIRSLELVAEIVATGRASPPFPRGFRALADTGQPALAHSHE